MGDPGLLGFAGDIYESFTKLDALNKLLALLTVVSFLVSVGGAPAWIVRRLMRRTSDELRIENKALSDLRDTNKRKIDALEQEIITLKKGAPASIIEEMQRERRDNNEVLAVRALIRGFQTIAPDTGQMAHELALHHLSTLPHMPRTGLEKAERFARIALLCLPGDRDRQNLLSEIIEIKADRQEAPTLDAIDNDNDEAVLEALFGLDGDVPTLINRLCDACGSNILKGYYRTAERLARRAVITARSRLGPSAPHTLSARYWQICSVHLLARHDEALDAVDALLPLHEKVKGTEHPDTFSTRYLRADILRGLARYDEALDTVDALLPLQAKVMGTEHHGTLTTRGLRAAILANLAQYDEALDAVDALLPLQAKVMGTEHHETLISSHLRAAILNDLARYDEALDTVDALLPLQAKVRGTEHPETLTTRGLRAAILANLAQYDEALDAVDALLPLLEKVKGTKHPETLTARALRAEILRGLARYDEAHEILETILPQMTACLPANDKRLKSVQSLWEQLRKNLPT